MSNTAREDQWEDFFNHSNVVRFDRRTKISLRDISDRNFLIEKFIYTLYTGCPAKNVYPTLNVNIQYCFSTKIIKNIQNNKHFN